MPELPEVEVMTRNLRRWARGRRVAALAVEDPTVLQAGHAPDLVGSTVGRVWRRAKYTILEADSLLLVVHYRMTGKVVVGPAIGRARWTLEFEDGSEVCFVDARRMGQVWVLPKGELDAFFEAKALGPDPYPGAHPGSWWAERLAGLTGPIKPALLKQDRVAGLGNIAAAEVLWRAKIDPRKAVPRLTATELDAIGKQVHAYLHQTIDREEADEIEYVNQGGPNPFAVYGRHGSPCSRCGEAIQRIVQSGRGTWLCPGCQPSVE